MKIENQTRLLKNGCNLKLILFLCTMLFNVGICCAWSFPLPQKNNSITCCYSLILKRIKTANAISVKGYKNILVDNDYKVTENNGRLTIKDKHRRAISLKSNCNSIDQWNNIIDWNKSKYLITRGRFGDVLISVAPVAGASGLQTNFYKYLIVDLKTGSFQIMQSLSNDPRFIYQNHGKLEVYLFDYSDRFISERDYANVSLKIDHYVYKSGLMKANGSEEKNCNCSSLNK